MEDDCRCVLFTRSPHSFSHDGALCGWPDLAQRCPDCQEEAEKCVFFSENAEETGCAGFTRLVALCIRCQLDGAKQRREPQLRQRIVILSGGESSQRAVAFATGHVKTYKDGLKVVDGVWFAARSFDAGHCVLLGPQHDAVALLALITLWRGAGHCAWAFGSDRNFDGRS